MSQELDRTDDDAMSDDAGSDSERNVLLVTYVLYGLGCFFFITAVAGVIVNHIKLGELRRHGGPWTHHRWQMRTFWFTMLWSAVCLILSPIGIGLLGYFVLWIWCFYRFVRGIVAFADRRPMPV
ncbi:hypothetical protein [Salinisphaera sp. Q1T1-3]|uniref:DUF4870 family protein n=1 Tax=Salinisphaera sp. Q1T1-3 TaxID=2321229 RepID=UPI000E70A9AC|nr:hypothetical protein [Salinisphaera sp. Q1T1-3]RJS92358.1 hypothetical protein D3260_11975 [Salinisphaera sp. Q1T1-3]